MAGSIPPLVSSSPPPLCAFDDEEEEEDDDEFGMYTAAEDIEFNECISFKENNGEKQGPGKCRGEQDSTSQDSATDSGLCPDSEGMSPTPHSDEERTVKHSASSLCDKLYQQPSNIPTLTNRLNPTSASEGLDSSGFSALTNLPNGHVIAEDSEDDFGNFENFEHTERGVIKPSLALEKESEPELKLTEHSEKEEINSVDLKVEEIQNDKEKDINEVLEGLNGQDDVEFESDVSTLSEMCANVETQEISDRVNSALDEINLKADIHIQEELQASLEECSSIDITISTIEQNIEIKPEVNELEQQDDEFDDFADFKADFSSFNAPNTEQCDNFSEYSKPASEQKHLEETVTAYVLTQTETANDASDDEFSDFTEFSSSDCAFVSAQKSNSVEHLSHIPVNSSDNSDLRTDSEFQDWVSVFPSSSNDSSVDERGDVVILGDNDSVWSRLIPMELSPALSYQWAESQANRHLLTALNIDSRNILMKPWMPRFAANLSCGPLQPVKAQEPLQPTLASTVPPVQVSNGPESVPDAHFDWVGSGLTNPLDYCIDVCLLCCLVVVTAIHSSLLDLNFMMTVAPHLTISPKPVLKLHKALTAEAETILSLLPDLSFMRKAYIDFPVNKG